MNMTSKTPEQCRTHHQKALKKYLKVEKIISNLLLDMETKLEKIKQLEEKVLEET